MQSLADHHTAVRDKKQHRRVEFQKSGADSSKWHARENPSFADPERHQSDYGKRHWDRDTFEILCFSARIVGDFAGGDVESSKTQETAEEEKGEQNVVERSTHADGEGCNGWSDAE